MEATRGRIVLGGWLGGGGVHESPSGKLLPGLPLGLTSVSTKGRVMHFKYFARVFPFRLLSHSFNIFLPPGSWVVASVGES